MDVLFIKPKHIGDSLLLTPTLAGVRMAHPEAKIWVLIREGAQGILDGCPQVDRILTTAQVDKHERIGRTIFHELQSAGAVLGRRFDYVFELSDSTRGRNFVLLSRSPRKFSVRPFGNLGWRRRLYHDISSFDWTLRHRVEKDYCSVAEFLPLPKVIPPLVFARESTRVWQPAAVLDDFAVVQVGTRQTWNRWHREGWLEAARFLLKRVERIILTCGPNPQEIAEAEWLREQLGPAALSTGGRADWAELADLLYRARLFLGPNTAAMHVAAACQCPVVTLFGPTRGMLWAPWKCLHRIVYPPHPVADDDPREWVWKRKMEDIAVSEVLAACEELLSNPQLKQS